MEYQRYGNKVIIRIEKNEELITKLSEVCQKETIRAALVQGIGYTDKVRVRIYDNRKDKFLFRNLDGPMEITGLSGNIILADNGIYPHIHIMAADEDANLRGGHLVRCNIAAVAEVILEVLPDTLRRGRSDELHLGTLRFENNVGNEREDAKYDQENND